MVCTGSAAGSGLAHTRWGTRPGGSKGRKRSGTKRKREGGTLIKEKEREAPGVAERRATGRQSTHFDDVVKDLERRAAKMDAKEAKKKKKRKTKEPKTTQSGPQVINTLIPRRKT